MVLAFVIYECVFKKDGIDKTSNRPTPDMLSFPYRMLPSDAKQCFLNEIH